jgi:hypothetical protein
MEDEDDDEMTVVVCVRPWPWRARVGLLLVVRLLRHRGHGWRDGGHHGGHGRGGLQKDECALGTGP